LFPVVNFFKCFVTEVLFSIVAFKTLTFHKVVSVATHLRVVGSLVIVKLLQMFSWFWQWKKFENCSVSIWWSYKAYKKCVPNFLRHPVGLDVVDSEESAARIIMLSECCRVCNAEQWTRFGSNMPIWERYTHTRLTL